MASQRPDIYVAISKRVKERIQKYYKRTATDVIYPPVNTDAFKPVGNGKSTGGYYLVVSRLVPYKRVDIVVAACTRLGKSLIVIGTGPDKRRLQRMAGPTVEFIDCYLTDKALVEYYLNCRAFLYAGDEDFGIVAAEAQSVGKPVIAYAKSGIAEIVEDGKTGILFTLQTEKDLERAMMRFESMKIQSSVCRKNAVRFDKKFFGKRIKEFVEKEYRGFKTIL